MGLALASTVLQHSGQETQYEERAAQSGSLLAGDEPAHLLDTGYPSRLSRRTWSWSQTAVHHFNPRRGKLASVSHGFETLQTKVQKRLKELLLFISSPAPALPICLFSSRVTSCFILQLQALQDRALHHGALTLGLAPGSTTMQVPTLLMIYEEIFHKLVSRSSPLFLPPLLFPLSYTNTRTLNTAWQEKEQVSYGKRRGELPGCNRRCSLQPSSVLVPSADTGAAFTPAATSPASPHLPIPHDPQTRHGDHVWVPGPVSGILARDMA